MMTESPLEQTTTAATSALNQAQRVLVSGGRLFSSLELGRMLKASGKNVYSIENVPYSICHASNVFTDIFKTPPPAFDTAAFLDRILQIVHDYNIELIVPNNEETFYLAALKDQLPPSCQIFCESQEKLLYLHSKWTSLTAIQDAGGKVPESHLLTTPQEHKALKDRSEAFVFKKEFTRSGDNLLIKPTWETLENHIDDRPYVAQKFISGKEYCSYTVAHHGKMTLHTCYEPHYRANAGGAAIAFTSHHEEQIMEFCKRFVETHNYHGQIGFDFIITDSNECYVIDCNPRATSGIHFFREFPNFNPLETYSPPLVAPANKSYCIGFGLIPHLGNLLTNFLKNPAKSFKRATHFKELVLQKGDAYPFWFQLWIALWTFRRTWGNPQKVMRLYSHDIAWDGTQD